MPLPGNGSNTRLRANQSYDFPSIHMEYSPSYPAVPSRGYLEPPLSYHPILSDGYEISPSLVNHGSRKVLLYEKGQESLLEFNHTRFEPKHLTVKLSPFSLMGETKNLVRPYGRESRRRLDQVDG